MATRGLFKPASSIKTKLLVLLLAMTMIATISIAMVAVLVNQVSGASAQKISSEALLTQAKAYLVQLTESNARENDLVLDQVKRETSKIAGFAAMIYDDPGGYRIAGAWKAEEHMTFRADGQFANSSADLSSVFVPNTVEINDRTIQDIEIGAYLDPLFASAYNNTPNVQAIYMGTPQEVVRYYPNIDLGAVLPPDFQATGRIWYSGSMPENNPDKSPWWTPPYVDATGRGMVTTAASPIYDSAGRLVGVIGLDLTLDDVRANVESTRFLRSGYSFLIDNTGHTVALPDQGFHDIFGRDPEEGEINLDLSQTASPFTPYISRMMKGESGFEQFEIDGRNLFIAFAPLQSTGWSLGSVIEAEDVLSSINTLQTEIDRTARSLVLARILPVSAIVFVLVTLLGLWLTNRLLTPIQRLATEAQKVGTGEWELQLPPAGNDEIGVLSHAFQVMVEQIHSFILDLERRVAERTRDLERRNTQLQVAAEVAREATAIHNLDELLELAINLIRGRFGFYHAGIFLLDDKNEYAILSAATGEAGREMLQRGHKLRVGQVGMVGYVTSSREPRITPDVKQDPTHYQNPLLPETRSEMTLPLQVGDRVIGALDVQSQYASAFDDNDITIMQVMADQLAIAIENARLLQQSQQMVRQLEKLYGSYSQNAWTELAESSLTVGYQFDQRGVHPVGRAVAADTSADSDLSPVPVCIPIHVRGQVVAELEAWPEEADLDLETQNLLAAIAERLGQTLENARLFEEAQQRAEVERLVGDVTSRLRQTMDIETILRTAAVEFRRALNLSEAEVRLGNLPVTSQSGNGSHSKPHPADGV